MPARPWMQAQSEHDAAAGRVLMKFEASGHPLVRHLLPLRLFLSRMPSTTDLRPHEQAPQVCEAACALRFERATVLASQNELTRRSPPPSYTSNPHTAAH
eukprot:449547-Rhodomonas_salina.2